MIGVAMVCSDCTTSSTDSGRRAYRHTEQVTTMDWPWFIWLIYPSFFNDEQKSWALQNAPCRLGNTWKAC